MRQHRQARATVRRAGDQRQGHARRDRADGALARHQLTQAKDAFKTRDVALAQELVAQDAGIGRLNREIFNRAVEIGDDIDVREWAMFMILVARALERIADNAVDIAEQTVFIVIGLFREFAGAGASQPA